MRDGAKLMRGNQLAMQDHRRDDCFASERFALIAITLNLGDLDRHKIRRIVHQCLSGLIRFILHSGCSFSLVNRVSTIAYFDLKVKPLFSLASNESWIDSSVDCRSEERRVGNECVSTCRSRGSSSHEKKNNILNINVGV